MGFFSGLVSTPKVKTPATGYYAQPAAYQQLYTNVLKNTNSTLPSVNADAFAPSPINNGERQGLDALYGGFTPDASQIQSDISMQMNPYDEYVINRINREAQGQNSLVQQNIAQSGQQGSNRSFLGSSDVEQNRLNNIGTFKAQQYNTALQNSLGTLANSRRQDATGALGAGTYERDLATQTAQAPYAAAQAQQSLLGAVPTEFGNFGYKASSSGGGLDAAKLLQTGAAVASFFSDRRLKQDIKLVGIENGHNIYRFAYKGHPDSVFIGVMADEVEKTHPDAVIQAGDYKSVDYGAIGVYFREAA